MSVPASSAPGARPHAHDHDHDHDHDVAMPSPSPDDLLPEGLERLSIVSVGLDVGSSTSHFAISRLTLRRRGSDLSSEFEVAERAVLYRSSVILTPYRTDTLIDAQELDRFLDLSYAEAGWTRDAIDTGVVIVTGEAANRQNAEEIARRFAARSGKFICVTAGPRYEALIAAHGSGAVELSRHRGRAVLNVDIGGGTTKLSIARGGEVIDTAAFCVGARLVAVDHGGVVTRLEPPLTRMAKELGFSASVGEPLEAEQLQAIARLMTDVLLDAVAGRATDLLTDLMLTPMLDGELLAMVDAIVFSGGVSEYVDGREEKSYGDLGVLLGRFIRQAVTAPDWPLEVHEAAQGIRATVLGAGEHSLQASGLTSHLSGAAALPASGLKVIRTVVSDAPLTSAGIRSAVEHFSVDGVLPEVAYAFVVETMPTYPLLRKVAEAVVAAADPAAPLYIMLDIDVAQALGGVIVDELGWDQPLVVLDGIHVGDLDYVDIGAVLHPAKTVPVTVKSLAFTHQKE